MAYKLPTIPIVTIPIVLISTGFAAAYPGAGNGLCSMRVESPITPPLVVLRDGHLLSSRLRSFGFKINLKNIHLPLVGLELLGFATRTSRRKS